MKYTFTTLGSAKTFVFHDESDWNLNEKGEQTKKRKMKATAVFKVKKHSDSESASTCSLPRTLVEVSSPLNYPINITSLINNNIQNGNESNTSIPISSLLDYPMNVSSSLNLFAKLAMLVSNQTVLEKIGKGIFI